MLEMRARTTLTRINEGVWDVRILRVCEEVRHAEDAHPIGFAGGIDMLVAPLAGLGAVIEVSGDACTIVGRQDSLIELYARELHPSTHRDRGVPALADAEAVALIPSACSGGNPGHDQ